MTLVDSLLDLVRFLLSLLTVMIIARAVLSWLVPRPFGWLATYLSRVTEPCLAPLRRISPRTATIDFSPVVAVLLAQLIIVALGWLY